MVYSPRAGPKIQFHAGLLAAFCHRALGRQQRRHEVPDGVVAGGLDRGVAFFLRRTGPARDPALDQLAGQTAIDFTRVATPPRVARRAQPGSRQWLL